MEFERKLKTSAVRYKDFERTVSKTAIFTESAPDSVRHDGRARVRCGRAAGEVRRCVVVRRDHALAAKMIVMLLMLLLLLTMFLIFLVLQHYIRLMEMLKLLTLALQYGIQTIRMKIVLFNLSTISLKISSSLISTIHRI